MKDPVGCLFEFGPKDMVKNFFFISSVSNNFSTFKIHVKFIINNLYQITFAM